MDGKLTGENGVSELHQIKNIKLLKKKYDKGNRRWGRIVIIMNRDYHRFLENWAQKQGYNGIASFSRKILLDILQENRVGYSRFIDDKFSDYKLEINGICLDD